MTSSGASPSIRDDDLNPTEQILWSARLDILLSLWRIGHALRWLREDADPLTHMRWSHGIGRELWLAISATGLETSISTVFGEQDHPRQCPPLQSLLKHLQWRSDRSLRFDVATFDCDTFLKSVRRVVDYPDFVYLEAQWSHPKWWTWGPEGPEDVRSPSWWTMPPEFVPHPMPLHSTDIQDLRSDTEALRVELHEMKASRKDILKTAKKAIARLEKQLAPDAEEAAGPAS
ncbi:hypothetical protein C8Q76DRAFT_794588 [Earliella scabrosa]|nr:hypothetical protein C8Q76DRAFT_794588 [Earliella scabrosa]